MSDVFLSYKKDFDEEKAKIFIDRFEKCGLTVWWDKRIGISQRWDIVIENALKDAKCVVVLWSKDSVGSEWVNVEATDGKERGILVPVLIDDIKPPLAFRLREAAKLIGWDGTIQHPEFELLISEISRILGRPIKEIPIKNDSLNLLKAEKVHAFNQFRIDHPEVKIDFHGEIFKGLDLIPEINLSGAELFGSKFHSTSLKKANLSGANLREADLSKTNLTESNLLGADLTKANLLEAKLNNADIRKAVLHEADLTNADLSGANLRDANLTGAKLFSADLSKAKLDWVNFSDADMTNAIFSDTDLSGLELSNAIIRGTDFSNANLSRIKLPQLDFSKIKINKRTIFSETDFSELNLAGASLSGLDLTRAIFSNVSLFQAKLNGANLREANLSGANLAEADLSGTDLTGANIVSASMIGISVDNNTKTGKIILVNEEDKNDNAKIRDALNSFDEVLRKIILRDNYELKRIYDPENIVREPPMYTNSIGMKFTLIPAGKFKMGSFNYKDEIPEHQVTISKSFYLGIHPVTQQEWNIVMENKPSYFKGDNLPVENVSWNDVQEFVKKLNQTERTDKYRLPSEAEWEYAARAGTRTPYSFNDKESKLGGYAWFIENSESKTHNVGMKKPNPNGLYDMHGNVREWVQDKWHDNYDSAPSDGSAWEERGEYDRVSRGGSWDDDASECRSAARNRYDAGNRTKRLGFRLVRDL